MDVPARWNKTSEKVCEDLTCNTVLLRVGQTVIMTRKNVQLEGTVLAAPTSTDSESSESGSIVSLNQ